MPKDPAYEELEQRVMELEKAATQARQAEEALRESEERFRKVFQSAPLGIAIANPQGKFIEVNDHFTHMLGYSKENARTMSFIDITYPEDREDILNLAEEVRAGKRDSYQLEKRYITQDGRAVWGIVRANAIRHKNGSVKYWLGIMEDITESKEAEHALRESEERYRHITECVTDYIYSVRVQGGCAVETTHGPACVAVTGYTAEELKANPYLWIEMVSAEDRELVGEHVRRILSGLTVEPAEHRIIRKDGALRWVRNTPVLHCDNEGELLAYDGLVQDITERKRLEMQLAQAQRMEAIGTLAGGIAHDFNNILMTIQGNTSLMLLVADPEGQSFKRLQNIEEAVQSGADLTSQLLAFARGGKYEVKPTDLNRFIKSQNRLFGRAKKEVTVRGKYEEDLWPVEVDRGQLGQALMDLYVNAADAMPTGGELHVKTENFTLDESAANEYPFRVEPGDYVRVAVTDTGLGMDEETQKRVFEPFFTTKGQEKGTGLGLASVYGIIKNHGGMINVESAKGKGSTFVFSLPACKKDADEEEKRPPKKILKGHEAILLVDDEEMIVEVGKSLLQELGYQVAIARGGKAAVNMYRKQRDKIDMVILDMIMPDLGGAETYNRLKKINPDIKVLLSSGYSLDGQANQILESGCNGFIQKPFNLKELSGKIRDILDNC